MAETDPVEEDLRATSDAIVEDLDRLQGLETRKRGLEPDDPSVGEISGAIVDLAERLHRNSVAQRELSAELAADGRPDSGRPIESSDAPPPAEAG